jgi:broad specificity phosphatase PhoE
MSELIIVRHGQASFLSGNYDQLSELGVEQARRLGEFWAAQGTHTTRFVVGPRKRHRQSADAILMALNAANLAPTEIAEDDRLDEFDWDGLYRYASSTLAERDPAIGALKQAFESAPDITAKRRTIQHYMEAVTAQWAAGTFHEDGLETWDEFRSRVHIAVKLHTRDLPSGSRVVLVTSGGVAAVSAGHVLGLDAPRTLGLIWTLRNGALVEYLFGGDRISLSSFNNAPHLTEARHWTYR